MASASTSIVTYTVPGGDWYGSVIASVINVNPTATTLFLQCASDADGCYPSSVALTVGPWAAATTSLSSSGTFDMHGTFTADVSDRPLAPWTTFTEGLHCEVTATTQVGACSGQRTQDGTSTASVVPTGRVDMLPLTITITAGLDKFAAATTASPTSTSLVTATHTPAADRDQGPGTNGTASAVNSTSKPTPSAPGLASSNDGSSLDGDLNLKIAGIAFLVIAAFLC
ncbi:hypothetical protein ANO11243_050900 [Dothideomycetidae sp. 11243]|nr:hypothetical protein ANO11243_050900 [fungal sp. No.11243]